MAKEKEKFVLEKYTKYEQARILGARALQISANAPILFKISTDKLEALNYDPIKIAELEFRAGVLPITVKRPLPRKIEGKLIEEPEKKIVTKEKELPKKEEFPEEKAKVEEAEEVEAEAEEVATTESKAGFSEESAIEELEKTGEESEEIEEETE